jgi:hypothetical protein
VTQWLVDFGIDPRRITHSDNKGWLAFDATTEEAEGLLHAEYHLYEHTTMGHVTAACDRCVDFYSICDALEYDLADANLVTMSRSTSKSTWTTSLLV